MRTRAGALISGTVAIGLFLLIGQIIPGALLAIVLIVQGEGKVSASELESLIVPYIPALVFGAMLFSVVFVGSLHWAGWLAPKPPPRGRPYYLGVLFWVAGLATICILASNAVLFVLTQFGWDPQEQEMILEAFKSGGVGFVLALVVFAPVGEELFFRRYLFSAVQTGSGRLAAYTFSSLAFALIHMNLSALPAYLVIAVCAAYAYEKTGTIWAAIGVHAANNATAVWFWGS